MKVKKKIKLTKSQRQQSLEKSFAFVKDYPQNLTHIQKWLADPRFSLVKSSGGWYWEWLSLHGESIRGIKLCCNAFFDFAVKQKILTPKFSKQEEKVQRALGLIKEGTPYILSKEYSTK